MSYEAVFGDFAAELSQEEYEVLNEREILAILCRNPAEIAKTPIESGDFKLEIHQQIFAALRAEVSQGREPDVLALAERIGNPFALEAVSRIWGQCIGSLAMLESRVDKLLKASRRMRMHETIGKAQDYLRKNPEKVDVARGRLILRLSELDAPRSRFQAGAADMMSAVADLLADQDESRKAGKPRGVLTGIPGLDKVLGGLHPGDLTIVGGRTSMGKTAFMLSVAYNMARAGRQVGIISSEMSSTELGFRLLALATGIDGQRLRTGEMSEDEFSKITQASGEISKLPVRVFDRPRVSAGDIALQARAWGLTGGLDVLFVDYLQRLEPERRADSRSVEVGGIAEGLKNIARTLKVPVVVLAQVNRQCEARDDKRPTLADLRDSGQIEQEADQVIFLYRPAVYSNGADPEAAEFIIDKNRHGPLVTVAGRFEAGAMRYSGSDKNAPLRGYKAPKGRDF